MEQIKIGDLFFKLVLNKQEGEDNGTSTSAHSSHWYQKIWINLETRPYDGIEADLWHEIVEMINQNYDLKLDHHTITTLGTAIHEVLIENESLFKNFPEIVKEAMGKENKIGNKDCN